MHEQNRRVTGQTSKGVMAGVLERHAGGALAIRRERRGDKLVLWLNGALDRATSALLEGECDAQMGAATRLVIDLTGLDFIDSSGLNTLARTHRRARENDQRLSFRDGLHLSQRPLELTRDLHLRSRHASRRTNNSNDDDDFPRALRAVMSITSAPS